MKNRYSLLEFLNNSFSSFKSISFGLIQSNLKAPKLAFAEESSLIRSAASCKSFSAALRALSACSRATLISSNSEANILARRSAWAAASRASSLCLCSSSI
ncbi:hypothetical protein BpHYR1_019514 [Brachionus plicatilis]|uniref:Uncharacterized protein n=1 Tax=Brachionus plicatilis TaxID=10195 RepID=A0A3M7PX58_BRAPC|nr:hypothetical protein BpHYR1_019514 [Brachionus plicatilis]